MPDARRLTPGVPDVGRTSTLMPDVRRSPSQMPDVEPTWLLMPVQNAGGALVIRMPYVLVSWLSFVGPTGMC